MRSRLDRGRDLLARTEMGMEDVAARSGYRDAKQLGAAFRIHLKTSPTAFRKALRGTQPELRAGLRARLPRW